MIDELKIVELKESILQDNDADANKLREELRKKGTFLVNVMSSPGSGKTTTLIALSKYLKSQVKMGVIEADIDGDVDGLKLQEEGIDVIQAHTGGMCHLDADMTRQSIRQLNHVDLAFLENIGNLVCPAEYDTGSFLNLVILSVPEGSDKPFKYTLMFSKADIVFINKMDAIEYFDFDFEQCQQQILKLNPDAVVLKGSSLKNEGIEELADKIMNVYHGWFNG